MFKPLADDSARVQSALVADDPATRRAVLAKIDDPAVLQRLGNEDSDVGVREYALARLCKLIESGGDHSLPLDERSRVLEAILTPILAERFAVKATEPSLRIIALQHVEREAFCAERAVVDPVAKVREAALERVHAPDHLATIARQARKRDKQISRNAKIRWQTLIAEQQCQEEIESVCRELENLEWDGETGRNAARFAQLEQSWQRLDIAASSAQRERFRQAHERFQEQLRVSAARRRIRVGLCQQLDRVLAGLRTSEEQPPEYSTTAETLRELEVEWAALGPADDPESRRLQRYFDEQRNAIEALEQALARQHDRTSRCRWLITRGEQLLCQAGRIASADVQRLERDWQTLTKPAATDLQTRFERLISSLQQRLTDQTDAQAVEQAALEATLGQLDQALADGELQQAIDLQEQAQRQLAENIGLDRQRMADFQQRLQAFAPRIAQLRDWRRWGTNRSRESLIETVEQLIGTELEPAELAKQVQQARTHWKTMEGTDGKAPRALWKRFDQVCEQAYAPVRAWRTEQAEQRQRNLATRREVCERIEHQLAGLETESSIDWRAVSRFEQKIQQQWQQSGPVDRRQHKVIERRYRAALERLRARLQPVLEDDLARRSQLIEQAEALIDAEDSRYAVETIKRLQNEWQPRVLATRRREQMLWKRFRAACDAVFARREQDRAAQRAEQRTLRERQDEVIGAVETLAGRLADSGDSADQRYTALRSEWDALTATGKPIERNDEQRFVQACQGFEQARERVKRRRTLHELQRLYRRAELCSRVERWVLEGVQPAADDLLRLRSDWSAEEPLDARSETAIRERFEQAMQALSSGASADYRQGLEKALAVQQQHCLRLEILLGLESPAEFAEARLRFRVSQLTESLSEREQTAAITTDWPAAVVLVREARLSPAPADPVLTARWQRILEGMEAQL